MDSQIQPVRTRIAPSPTGQDLHIGNAYTALINYILAKKFDGQFIVRIEDTDRKRLVPGSEAKILSSLAWLGIAPDEGPDKGGAYGPYRQSQRLDIYKAKARELIIKGGAYYCFCTSERLAQMRQAQELAHTPPMYDGTCKKISPEEAQNRVDQGEPYTIRLNVPDQGKTVFTDLIRGEISFENSVLDDQVLLKSDGFPTYHLGVVVDDHLMKVSHVVRGEEWISSTPKHILLYQFFDWELPTYAHMPLLRNPDKSKLSKRKNPVWVSWYKEQGFLPEAVINYLGTLAWAFPGGKDIFTVAEMMTHFDLSQVKTTAPIFDIQKLKWMNGEYIRKAQSSIHSKSSGQELKAQISEFFENKYPKNLVEKLVPLAQDRMKTLAEFALYIKPFVAYQGTTLEEKYRPLLAPFGEWLSGETDWQAATLETKAKDIVAQKQLPIREAFMALRLATTGERIGLPLFESWEILGKTTVTDRLKKHL